MRDVTYDGDIEWINKRENQTHLYSLIKELAELYIDIQNNSEYSVDAGLELEYLTREVYNPLVKLVGKGRQEVPKTEMHSFAEAVYLRYFAPTVYYEQTEHQGKTVHVFRKEDSALIVREDFEKALESLAAGFKQPIIKLKPKTPEARAAIQDKFKSHYFDNKIGVKIETEETVMGKPKKVNMYKTLVLVD